MTATFTVSASAFRNLVTPVLPLACRDGMIPVLNAVLFRAADEYVTATATDRYRLGICRVEADEPPTPGLSLLIAVPELRRLLTVFKPTRGQDPPLTFTADEDCWSVEQGGVLHGFTGTTVNGFAVPGEYPAVDKLLRDGLDREPLAGDVALNAEYLADFRHALRDKTESIVVRPHPTKPTVVTVGDHFIGCIMPRTLPSTLMGAGWAKILTSTLTAKAAS